jgi:putative FmdB family regulatory protein
MPIYEFQCSDCGEKFSEIRRMGEDSGGPCPNCGSENTKKLISSFSSITSGGSSGGCPTAPGCPQASGGG